MKKVEDLEHFKSIYQHDRSYQNGVRMPEDTRKLEGHLTLSSNIEIAIPDAAPEPASPMKCPLPILLANRDAPTWKMMQSGNYAMRQEDKQSKSDITLTCQSISIELPCQSRLFFFQSIG